MKRELDRNWFNVLIFMLALMVLASSSCAGETSDIAGACAVSFTGRFDLQPVKDAQVVKRLEPKLIKYF